MEPYNRVDYVDTADALKRLAGKTAIYKMLLGKFLSGDHYTPIETAISSRNMDDAIIATHTLKGLSANLSLHKISELSAVVEAKCKEGDLQDLSLDELKNALAVTRDFVAEVIAEL